FIANDHLQPPDAFEVALLNPQTFQPLAGVAMGLSQTDALLNIQQTGEVFFAPGVNVSGVAHSGDRVSLDQPLTVRIDLANLTAGTPGRLYFDLLGFGATQSAINLLFATAPPTGGGQGSGGGEENGGGSNEGGGGGKT